MSKAPQFYERYIVAVFKRGRSGSLPMDYILGEAKRVLKEDEMDKLQSTLNEMVTKGDLLREGDFFRLKEEHAG